MISSKVHQGNVGLRTTPSYIGLAATVQSHYFRQPLPPLIFASCSSNSCSQPSHRREQSTRLSERAVGAHLLGSNEDRVAALGALKVPHAIHLLPNIKRQVRSARTPQTCSCETHGLGQSLRVVEQLQSDVEPSLLPDAADETHHSRVLRLRNQDHRSQCGQSTLT